MLVLFSIFYATMQSKLYRFFVVHRSRLRIYVGIRVKPFSTETVIGGNCATTNEWEPFGLHRIFYNTFVFVLKALCLNSNFLRSFYVPT